MTFQGKQVGLPVTDPDDRDSALREFQKLIDRALAAQAAQAAGRPEPAAAIAGEYLDGLAHRVAPKTRADYAVHLRWLVARFGDLCTAQMDPAALEKRAAAEGWSDSHRNNVLYTCQAFVRWAGRKDFTLARPPKESRGADSVIPPEVYTRLLRESSGDFHQLIRGLWLTGARPMELGGLACEAVDWASGTASLRRHKTRHKGKRRVIYLSTEAAAVLREQFDRYGGQGPLFRGQRGGSFTRRALVDRFRRLSERAGHKVRAYDFRHTFITRSLVKGVPAAMVAALVGTSVGMIDRFYGHVAGCSNELRDAAERLAG